MDQCLELRASRRRLTRVLASAVIVIILKTIVSGLFTVLLPAGNPNAVTPSITHGHHGTKQDKIPLEPKGICDPAHTHRSESATHGRPKTNGFIHVPMRVSQNVSRISVQDAR
jgi:hypothetical protein